MNRIIVAIGAGVLGLAIAGGGYFLGAATVPSNSSEVTGYELAGSRDCNFWVWGDLNAYSVSPTAIHAPAAKNLYEASLGCTTGEVEEFNRLAASAGDNRRFCWEIGDPLTGLVRTWLPDSCAKVADER